MEPDRLITRPRRSKAQREANAKSTGAYRERMKRHGIPDRAVVAETMMRLVLLEVLRVSKAGGDKDSSLDEHRILGTAIKELLKFKAGDGSPLYTAAGVRHRIYSVLCDLQRLPRPAFDENMGKGKNTKPQIS